MSYEYKITVFTPTYNRAYIIEALYRSLQRQTFRDFEWIIVDDGSTDQTEAVITQWQNAGNVFPIRYFKKENGGKCRAINYGVNLANGLLFLNVDSDDYLTDDALEKIARWESELPKDKKFCGVVGNLGITPTETPNQPLPGPYFDANLLARYSEYSTPSVNGERSYAFYTSVQKAYPYPEFPGEKFITEASSWNRMANAGYLARFYNDITCIYEYKEDGLTFAGSKLFLNNPQGHGLWLREKAKFIGTPLWYRLKMYYSFYCDHSHHLPCKKIAEYIGAPVALMLFYKLLRLPLSILRKIQNHN